MTTKLTKVEKFILTLGACGFLVSALMAGCFICVHERKNQTLDAEAAHYDGSSGAFTRNADAEGAD